MKTKRNYVVRYNPSDCDLHPQENNLLYLIEHKDKK